MWGLTPAKSRLLTRAIENKPYLVLGGVTPHEPDVAGPRLSTIFFTVFQPLAIATMR